MNEYVILIGLPTNLDLGEDAERDKSRRLWAIHKLMFSLGPAWSGNQGSILLKSDLTRDEIVTRISPLIGDSDVVAVMQISTRSITTIGWIADEEGFDSLCPNVEKFGVSRDGSIYRRD